MFDSQVLVFTQVAALMTVFGICSGHYAHAMHSVTAFTALKIAGACNPVWLGIQSPRSAGQAAATRPVDAACGSIPVALGLRLAWQQR